MRFPVRLGAALAAAALVLSGCGTGAGQTTTSAPPKTRVVVFAAASLTAAFKQIAADNPQLEIAYTFDGSPTLVEQLNAKPDVADVLATADEANMGKATGAGLITIRLGTGFGAAARRLVSFTGT